MTQFFIKQRTTRKQSNNKEDLSIKIEKLIAQLKAYYGNTEFMLMASKLEAAELIQADAMDMKILGLLRIMQQDPTLNQLPVETKLELIFNQLEEKLVDLLARRAVEQSLQVEIQKKMEENYKQYVQEVKLQVLKEQHKTNENAQTFKKLGALEKMEHVGLNRTVLDTLRPSALDEIVGQEKAVKALLSKLTTPFPQHILLYGPPGVGKTTCARLALEMAKQRQGSVFREDSPFVEVDGTTLRWDPRESTNPLLGSVHDPIYQGARRELADEGIPEPKLGMVSEAHGGILFIDEIGEMDTYLQNKLLKVMEDKRVFFESSYYDPNDEKIPQYIRKMFEEGVPADFVLIGATTREREEISPAFRSRCLEVFFEPLNPEDVKDILDNSMQKLGIKADEEVSEIIANYCTDGRSANKMLVDAYSLCLLDNDTNHSFCVKTEHIHEAIQNSQRSPAIARRASSEAEAGKIFGVGVSGHVGRLIEIESVAFPAHDGNGSIRFNDTAGSMAKDSVANAASVFRKENNEKLNEYDVHVNLVGGGKVDGPSAGAAIYLAICSAIYQKAIRQDVAITGEISIQGMVKPVGGVFQKILGAKQAGIKKMIIPIENIPDIPSRLQGITIVPIKTIAEAYQHIFIEN
ncbi:MAG: Lon family ATP-dependent protease [Bacillota bacterium]|nr:Lon family ATP-dependent protease [Bacillota bacterium]